jgi:hypothetical protein
MLPIEVPRAAWERLNSLTAEREPDRGRLQRACPLGFSSRVPVLHEAPIRARERTSSRVRYKVLHKLLLQPHPCISIAIGSLIPSVAYFHVRAVRLARTRQSTLPFGPGCLSGPAAGCRLPHPPRLLAEERSGTGLQDRLPCAAGPLRTQPSGSAQAERAGQRSGSRAGRGGSGRGRGAGGAGAGVAGGMGRDQSPQVSGKTQTAMPGERARRACCDERSQLSARTCSKKQQRQQRCEQEEEVQRVQRH